MREPTLKHIEFNYRGQLVTGFLFMETSNTLYIQLTSKYIGKRGAYRVGDFKTFYKKEMKNKMIDFGSFVSKRTEQNYMNGIETDIVGLFEEFTKIQQKATLSLKEYVETWIEDWCNLFPKGIKSGGKAVRSHPKSCINKMVDFVKTYKYDRDIIFLATEQYLFGRHQHDYNFTQCATYFINHKERGSTLAEWCEQYKDLKEEKQIEYNDFI